VSKKQKMPRRIQGKEATLFIETTKLMDVVDFNYSRMPTYGMDRKASATATMRIHHPPEPTFFSTRVDGAPSIELRGFPAEIHVAIDPPNTPETRTLTRMVKVEMQVRHRDTGERTRIVIANSFPDDLDKDPRALADFVRYMVREALLHELDECLYLDGKRLNDPHANEHP
jgi:hypothetical protein